MQLALRSVTAVVAAWVRLGRPRGSARILSTRRSPSLAAYTPLSHLNSYWACCGVCYSCLRCYWVNNSVFTASPSSSAAGAAERVRTANRSCRHVTSSPLPHARAKMMLVRLCATADEAEPRQSMHVSTWECGKGGGGSCALNLSQQFASLAGSVVRKRVSSPTTSLIADTCWTHACLPGPGTLTPDRASHSHDTCFELPLQDVCEPGCPKLNQFSFRYHAARLSLCAALRLVTATRRLRHRALLGGAATRVCCGCSRRRESLFRASRATGVGLQ